MRVIGFAIGVLALVGCTLSDGPLRVTDDHSRAAAGALPADRGDQPEPDSALAPSELAPEPDTLTLAAECMERGDRAGAAMHLECYVCRHPEQAMFRAQLAEMHLRLERDTLARTHFERFLADAAPANGSLRGQIINAHTRLMEIAQRANDRFGEVFHRGAGLLLLAREEARLSPVHSDPGFAEEMTCQALAALREAKELKPSDARTRVYLAEALARCGNHRAAGAERIAMRKSLLPGNSPPRQNCLVVDSIDY